MKWIADNAVGLLGVVVTLGLLAVTAVYTRATNTMAKTAERAAEDSKKAVEAAERSASAALEAAQVAQSQTTVEFKGETIPVASDDGGPSIPSIEIWSVADSVVVQNVRIRYAFRRLPNDRLEAEPCIQFADMDAVGDTRLPRRVHKSESILLSHKTMRESSWPVARFLLDIDYAFSENGLKAGTKRLTVERSDSPFTR